MLQLHEVWTCNTDQLQVYSPLSYDDVCQGEGEVDSCDVREIEIKTATGVLHYHQRLELIDMSHNVTLCIKRRGKEREI